MTYPIEIKALYTRKEAARYLGVAAQTLASWKCNETYDLPTVIIGRRVSYWREDLDRFIKKYRSAKNAS